MNPAADDPDPPDADLVRPYLPRPAAPEGNGGGTGPGSLPDGTEDEVVRPYLLTAGRVYTGTEVRIETQVMATGTEPIHGAGLDPEQRRVLSACAEPLSVAELAAVAGLHLGVALLLVADLAERGNVTLFLPQLDARRRADIIRKVMSGLDVLC